jgi:hypothetical protein
MKNKTYTGSFTEKRKKNNSHKSVGFAAQNEGFKTQEPINPIELSMDNGQPK